MNPNQGIHQTGTWPDTKAPPTLADPLGVRDNPASILGAFEKVIDARIEERLRGRTTERFDGVQDIALVHELLARGWAVFKPQGPQV